jgi:hypothetical protein
MKSRNTRRQILTAVVAATVAFAAPGTAPAGAVGGPEHGLAPVIGWPGVDPRAGDTSPARRPLPRESLQQVRSATRAAPVAADDFDWADAGLGAAGVVVILGVLGGSAVLVRRHRPVAHS